MNCRKTTFTSLIALSALAAVSALAQTCPEPLQSARRLVLVTADNMDTSAATMQLFERASPADPWRPLGPAEPALVGRKGMGWGYGFYQLGQGGEPVKVEGDKKTPMGIYRIGVSFGFASSSRPGYIQIKDETVCIDDPASPDYNTITSRATAGAKARGENMRSNSPYRRGLIVDYPTSAATRAGSCIFIHVQRSATEPTAGCVSLPEARVVALQDFAEQKAVLVVLPRAAFGRLPGCLPQMTAAR